MPAYWPDRQLKFIDAKCEKIHIMEVLKKIKLDQMLQGSKLRPIRSHLRLNFTSLRLEKRE